ncbi:MAG: hypothetical protein K9G62_03345 [Alphaproteobacteria bacterium]|nr:hypothetical protein [Alphaproteobacteria bacterium]
MTDATETLSGSDTIVYLHFSNATAQTFPLSVKTAAIESEKQPVKYTYESSMKPCDSTTPDDIFGRVAWSGKKSEITAVDDPQASNNEFWADFDKRNPGFFI